MIAAPVPPTTHGVAKPHRLRLMRSTRKLAALLGTTPVLLESAPPSLPSSPISAEHPLSAADAYDSDPGAASSFSHTFPPRTESPSLVHPRSPRSGSSSSSSSHGSRPSTSSGDTRPARPTLFLRHTNSVTGPRVRVDSHGWGRPATLPGTLPSPVSPTAPENEAEHRRRKMARVMRTLGERVPVDLVFPASPVTSVSDAGSDTLCEGAGAGKSSSSSSSSSSSASMFSEAFSDGDEELWVADLKALSRDRGVRSPEPTSTRPSLSSAAVSSISADKAAKNLRKRSIQRGGPGWTGEWNVDEQSLMKGLRQLK
ncbi:unnamed protein product [Mycena citricolor]|uniref:Uncharacterized protein n=1 Tax=Mycena citricolor TaxID=2018698 RepID=A0AAD2HL11_9AGAR|nr:unnamed protein product [Mycena citricolor]